MLVIAACAVMARGETLERTIPREDPRFDPARAVMSVGRDGNVYLTNTDGRNGFLLRVSRDGRLRVGSTVAGNGLGEAAANADGIIGTANGHMTGAVFFYDPAFRQVGGRGGFAMTKGAGATWPTHVEAGKSGDFYADDAFGKSILQISPGGVVVKTHQLMPAAQADGFRVCEATETLIVRGSDGETWGVGFDGDVRWRRKLPQLLAVDDAGKIYALDKAILTTAEPDELEPGEMVWKAAQVKLPADQVAGVNALGVYGDELIVKRPHPTELFQVYDLATGRQKRVVHAEHDRVKAVLADGPWTAGATVPLTIRVGIDGSETAKTWRVWASPFGDDRWREWTWANDRLEVPADTVGLYQLRIGPALNPPGGAEFTLRSVVEIRAAGSQGTVTAWTPFNRVWWGRGEAIPVSVAARMAGKSPTITVSLTMLAPNGGAAALAAADKPVWSAEVTAGTDRTLTIPAALTSEFAPGRYELRPQAPGLASVPQPVRIGPGAAAKSTFRVTLHGDYDNFNSKANAWEFADTADEMLARSLRLGVNQYVNRVTEYRYPLAFADTPDAAGLLRKWRQRLAAEPQGVPPEKVDFGFPQAHALGAFGAHGIREWLMLVKMDSSLPLGTPNANCGPITVEGAEATLAALTVPLRDFPAFQGWDWVANWWAERGKALPQEEKAAKAEKPPALGDEEEIDADAILGEVEAEAEARRQKPVEPTEMQRYDAALKRAAKTGAWDPALDPVVDRLIGWQAEAQQVFAAGLAKTGVERSTANSGPYRRPEVYPPDSFSNVDEIDLHYQAEQFTTPNWTLLAADYYKRPGKPAWIHPELWNDTGTGEMILPFSWMAMMRGVDGIGVSGLPVPGQRSVFRSLNAFAGRYGPWLTTLDNRDHVGIVVSRRQVGMDGFRSFGGLYFGRLWEAHQCCLHARHPATFLFAEDVRPGSLERFKAVLVVGQQFEPEPPLAQLLADAGQRGIAIFADGTCREGMVAGTTPLGVSFDHVEKLNGFNNENAFSEFPEAILATVPAVAAKLDAVAPPVAKVDRPEVLVSERGAGDARFVWVVNNTRVPLGQGQLWRVSSGVCSRQPVVAEVAFPVDQGHVVYEVFDGKQVASRSGGFRADLRYTGARLYAVLPHAIEKLEVVLSGPLDAGSTVSWRATVPGIEAPLPLHVAVRDAAGRLLDERFTTTGTGTLTVPVNAALPVGLEATELISGRTARPAGSNAKVAPARSPAADCAPPADLFGPRLGVLAIAADGSTAVAGSRDWAGNLWAVDLATGTPRRAGNVGDHFAYAVKAVPGGYVAHGYELASGEGNHLYRLDGAGQVERRFAFPGITARSDQWIDAWAVSPDGKWIAAAGNLALAVWSAEGKLLWSQDWSSESRKVPRLLTLGNDRLVVAKGMTISAVDAATGREAWTATPDPDGHILGLDAGADGRTVLARAGTRGGRVFLVRDGETVGTLKTAAAAAVAPADGAWVAVTNDRELKCYRPDGGLSWTFRADDTLGSLRLSPDGRRLAVGSSMGTLYRVDVESGEVRSLDLNAEPVVAWTPEGDLVAATCMGTVARLDAELREVWRVNLSTAADARKTEAVAAATTARLTTCFNAAAAPLPLVPNLLAAPGVAVRATNGSSGMGLDNPVGLLFDGQPAPPPRPWLPWEAVCAIDFWRGPFSLEIESPSTLRVKAMTFVEDPDHPESWVRDARLEYWDQAKNMWVFAQYLTSDAAVHSHTLAKPIEAAKFRLTRPDGRGWPVGSLRLAEIVFHGDALAAAKP